MSSDRLLFYKTRLTKSSPMEWLHRGRELLFLRAMKRMPSVVSSMTSLPLKSPEEMQAAVAAVKLPPYLGTVDAGLRDELFAGRVFTLHADPESIQDFEGRTRSTHFTEVNAGPGDPDIRAVWEKGRLQHFTLLLTYLEQHPENERADDIRAFVRRGILDWIDANPYLKGAQHMCVMEHGLRLPVFLQALKTPGVFENDDERKTVLQAMYEHAWITRRRISRHSSSGNHTTAECLGLVVAGALFKGTPEGDDWLETAVRTLEEECPHQIYDDGGPVEQSFSYHRFVLDMFWFAVKCLELNKLHDCEAMKARLNKGEVFLSAFFINDAMELPDIGDNDGGSFPAPGLAMVERSKPERGEALHLESFPDAGYDAVRRPDGLFMVFDHGILGMPPLFNHGHADALSFHVYKKGVPFIVDAGTYRYNHVPEWRRYFKGTAAHNTVTIDGKDQAKQVTGFIWQDSYAVDYHKEDTPTGIVVGGRHDGYAHGSGGVHHARTVQIDKEGPVIVRDSFQGKGLHHFEFRLHLHPDVQAEEQGAWRILSHAGEQIAVALTNAPLNILKGSKEPMAGWFSRGYGQMEESITLSAAVEGTPGDTRFELLIMTNATGDFPDPEDAAKGSA